MNTGYVGFVEVNMFVSLKKTIFSNLTENQTNFNYKLSFICALVERKFTKLKNKFKLLSFVYKRPLNRH
jgi:hypothetical protein